MNVTLCAKNKLYSKILNAQHYYYYNKKIQSYNTLFIVLENTTITRLPQSRQRKNITTDIIIILNYRWGISFVITRPLFKKGRI